MAGYKRSFGGASGLPHQTPGKSRNFGKLARIMALAAVCLSVVMVCPYTLCTGAEYEGIVAGLRSTCGNGVR